MSGLNGARYATARTPGLVSFGARVNAIATYMGGRLMPWQQQVADVALQLDPDTPGAWRYPTVVISVPRQAGKSFLLRAVMADRLLSYRDHEILMTAQTGRDARKRWAQLIAALNAEKTPGAFKVRQGQGSEKLICTKTGSFIAPFAPTPKSVHGDSLHLITIDEAWAFDAAAGAALESAVAPTQLTIKDSQTWIVSTRGTTNSAYLDALIEKGRASIDDPGSQIAYFEWSADPRLAEEDPYGDETLAFHPALGHTQTLDKLRSFADNTSLASWKRGALNVETISATTELDVPAIAALHRADLDETRPENPRLIHLGIDIATGGKSATIAAAWKLTEKTFATSIIMHEEGTDWLAAAISRLTRAKYGSITIDPSNTNRTVLTAVQARDNFAFRQLTQTKSTEYASACQFLLDAFREKTIAHSADEVFLDACRNAVTKTLGSAIAFNPAKSLGAIDPLRATALAVHAAAKAPKTPGQLIY